MRFLSISQLAAYALLATVAGLILLLYLLKPRTRQVVVSSMLLWRPVLARRWRAAARWRWLLSLLLALGCGLSIALALTRPEVPIIGGVTKRIVLLLDNSPSMAARTLDGESRWRHAIEFARRIVQRAGTDSQVAVMDTMGRASVAGFVSRETALASLNRLPVATFGAARIPPLPVDGRALEIHLFTDGVTPLNAPAGAIVHSTFEPVDNVAVTAFEARPLATDPTRYQAFVEILNASPGAKQVRLAIRGDPQFTLVREMRIPAGGTVDETFDVTGFGSGVLRAEVQAPGDGFDLDDVAYAFVPPHQARRVMLVTAGNRFLEDSIRSLPGIQLTTRNPSAYRSASDFDAYVFDRFTPVEAPTAGALLFRPSAAGWLTNMPNVSDNPSITRWDESDPLTAGVAWQDIRLRRAALTDHATGVVLARGRGEGALITAVSEPAPRIQVGFSLQDSNFQLQPGFPVFLGNALSWLTNRTSVLVRDVGSIQLPLVDADVRKVNGDRVATTRAAAATLFEAARPGVYTVMSGGMTLQIVANILDSNRARINESRFETEKRNRTTPLTSVRRWSIEPRVALLLLGAVLLVLEWAAFSRRITV